MNAIDPVFLSPVERMPSLEPIAQPGVLSEATAPGGFGGMFTESLASLNRTLTDADMGVRGLAVGSETNLHQVMMKLEDAKLSLQFALQVRNRLLEAYGELTRMPM